MDFDCVFRLYCVYNHLQVKLIDKPEEKLFWLKWWGGWVKLRLRVMTMCQGKKWHLRWVSYQWFPQMFPDMYKKFVNYVTIWHYVDNFFKCTFVLVIFFVDDLSPFPFNSIMFHPSMPFQKWLGQYSQFFSL